MKNVGGQGCGETGAILYCWWEYKLVQLLWKTVWRLLTKLKIEQLYEAAVPLLSIYSKEMITESQRVIYILMFIAVLFRVANI